ncbi:MAG: hypothetical protein AAF747_07760 [Planctomycetota bacterium]
MVPKRASSVVAAACGMATFALAVGAGLAVGNEPVGVMMRALVAMFFGYIVGLVLGAVGARAIDEHVEEHEASKPVPEIESDAEPGSGRDDQMGLAA